MLKFFYKTKKPKPDPDDSDSDAEDAKADSDEDDTPLDIFSQPFAVQTWGADTQVSYHFLSIRDVAPHLSSWCFNRKMDEEHKNTIKDNLLSNENPHLMGSIQIVRDKSMKCRVLNGQHRLAAIQEIIKDDFNMEFQMNVMFEVYNVNIEDIDDVSNINAHDTIADIFKIANNSLNMKPEQDHDIFCKQIMIAMMNDSLLKKGIMDKTSGNVYRPRISAKLLYELFKTYLPTECLDLDIQEIIMRIKKINVKISTMPFIELYGRHTPAQQKISQFEKAKKLGFYLYLESKMTPDIWIELLNTII